MWEAENLAKWCSQDQVQAPQLAGPSYISTLKQQAAQRQVAQKPALGKKVKAEGGTSRSADPWALGRVPPTQRSSEVSGQWEPLTFEGELTRIYFLLLSL